MIPDCRIQDYINLVRSNPYPICEEQFQLCDMIERIFAEENLIIDSKQLDRYMGFQKYFPFDLLDWEKFVFALHNCVYKQDGELRFPILFVYVGRGAGKNGYLGFEDFCMLTPVNGIPHYDIDIFAMSEKQAKTSFNDVYDMLEDNRQIMSKHFRWTKEAIVNLKTKSEFTFNTSSPKTKDGFRPGKVDFDEYHAYQNMKLVDVAVTGLGKVPHPRRTIVTTDGDVRDGPLDTLLEKSHRILNGEIPDNGTLPFICRIKDKKMIADKANWSMANPSYPYFKNLQTEMELEYQDYLLDPIGNASFATKRCNCPQGDREAQVTSWENILATNQPIPEFAPRTTAIAGLDYASTEDFLGAGLLIIENDIDYFIGHLWVCEESKDLHRVKAPLKQWEEMGLVTYVPGPEINPDIPAMWLAEMGQHYNILEVGIDKYRHALLAKSLVNAGFTDGKDGNIKILRPSDEMMAMPVITSLFNNQKIVWGNNPALRWCCNNSKREKSPGGNWVYGKIEPKSRKTDLFKAFVAAEILREDLIAYNEINQSIISDMDMQVFTY